MHSVIDANVALDTYLGLYDAYLSLNDAYLSMYDGYHRGFGSLLLYPCVASSP